MNIKDEFVYTADEVAKELSLSVRAIQDRCKRSGLKKEGKNYLIPGIVFKEWIAKAKRRNENKTKKPKDLREYSLDELINYIEESSGKQVYLFDESDQQQFLDIYNSQEKLKKDIKVRDREFSLLEESKEHYKKQADYFIHANEKLTNMLDKLTSTLKESVDNTRRQQTLNAKDKDII